MQLETRRLTVRPWRPADLDTWSGINADPEARRFYHPPVLTRPESDAGIERCMRHLDDHGFSFLALERREDQALVGGAGLSWTEHVPGGRAVEIGWIVARRFWRRGYAREAGRAWLALGWSVGLDQIVGYTSAVNLPSRALMEALGMTRDPADDFADPTVPPTSPLSPHVLYRVSRLRGG